MKPKPFSRGHIISIGLALGWSVSTALPLLADTPAVSSFSSWVVTSSSAPTMIGWKFTVETPIIINALGLCTSVPMSTSPSSADVGLWNGSGTQLASCLVLSNDVVEGSFTYHPISPVTLQPGQNYTVACLLPTGAGWVSQVDSISFAQGIDFVARRFDFSPFSTLFMPTVDRNAISLGDTIGGFGASFSFIPVPEPSTFALGGMGAIALMIFRRRK